MINFKADKTEQEKNKEIARNARFNYLPKDYKEDFLNPANDSFAMEMKKELKRQISWTIGIAGYRDSSELESYIWKDNVTEHIREIINISTEYASIQA